MGNWRTSGAFLLCLWLAARAGADAFGDLLELAPAARPVATVRRPDAVVQGRGPDVQSAAHAIARHHARGAPELRAALGRLESEYQRRSVHEALDAIGAYTLDEKRRGVEVWMELHRTAEGRLDAERARMDLPGLSFARLDERASLGAWVLEYGKRDDALARALLALAAAPERFGAEGIRVLKEALVRWEPAAVPAHLVARLEDGQADVVELKAILDRRAELRAAHRERLARVARGSGEAAGVAAAALGEPAAARAILEGTDAAAQRGLVAAARYLRTEVPFDRVAALFHAPHAAVSAAAREYLVSLDSSEARRALESDARAEFVITGARPDPDSICQRLEPMLEWEPRLQREVLAPDGPEEILALLDAHEQIVVRRTGSAVRLSVGRDRGLGFTREVTAAELAELRVFLQKERVHELPPLAIMDCHSAVAAEFVHLSKHAGRRLFAIAPWHHDAPQMRLVKRFQELARPDGRITYDAVVANPGAHLLYSSLALMVDEVWTRGEEIRIRLVGYEGEQRIEGWYRLAGTARGPETTRPAELAELEPFRKMGQPGPCLGLDHRPFWSRAGDVEIRAGSYRGRCGLWRLVEDREPEHLRDGVYGDPVITPDGTWVVAAKTDRHWGVPNGAVRIDLGTKKEYDLPIPRADTLETVAYIASRSAVLMRRHRDRDGGTGPHEPAFELVDPRTGRVSRIAGELTPFEQMDRRALQPTGRPGEVWAALRRGDDTDVGRYDMNTLRFERVRTLVGFSFGSARMWIEEHLNRITFVADQKLFAAPLR